MRSRTGLAVVAFVALVSAMFFVGIATIMTPNAAGTSDAALPSTECVGDETHPPDDFHPWAIMSRSFGYEMTVNESIVEPGDPIEFSLTNGIDRPKATDGKARYVLQQPKAAGWETLTAYRGAPIDFHETNDTLDPDETYEWTFRANATGFWTDRYVVCETLSPGIYRFVYVGGEYPVGVRFEIEPRSTPTPTASSSLQDRFVG